ncbi:hypothetical protein COCNU_16G000830 [Cocos nucifera]|uniref:ABC transmembrane type-1 domain-containing protein n=1 Tax=Cocos nucifera TaxID=13894 RepID=A0A8K0IXU2_COCNU|nr:hypothetical protein COCNU_16G000830 [Cocos nucifera]
MQDQHESEKSGKQDDGKHTVLFCKLFGFADSTDIILTILGTVGAVANGLALPLMTVLFGDLIQSFAGASDIHDVIHRVSKVALEFGSGVASFLRKYRFEEACWMAAGERQAARIRNLYLKTILRQEIAFFDKETNTREVVERMSGDTVLIKDAMGEKEMNKESDNATGLDQDKSDIGDSGRHSSKKLSFTHSISQGSSKGQSSCHSFQKALGVPIGIDIQTNTTEQTDILETKVPPQEQKEVPLHRLAYLSKPEIPVFLLGSIAAIIHGVILPIFAILLSNMITTFYQPLHKLKKDSNFWSFMFLVFGVVSLLALPA